VPLHAITVFGFWLDWRCKECHLVELASLGTCRLPALQRLRSFRSGLNSAIGNTATRIPASFPLVRCLADVSMGCSCRATCAMLWNGSMLPATTRINHNQRRHSYNRPCTPPSCILQACIHLGAPTSQPCNCCHPVAWHLSWPRMLQWMSRKHLPSST